MIVPGAEDVGISFHVAVFVDDVDDHGVGRQTQQRDEDADHDHCDVEGRGGDVHLGSPLVIKRGIGTTPRRSRKRSGTVQRCHISTVHKSTK